MVTRKIMLVLMLVFLCQPAFAADRALSEAETLELLTTLTQNPQKTWIPAGTIEAQHIEYRAPQTYEQNEIALKIQQETQNYIQDENKIQRTEKLQNMRLEAIPFNVRYKLTNEYTMVTNVVVKYDGSSYRWEINVASRSDSVQKPIELQNNYLTDEFNLYGNEKRLIVWDGHKQTRYYRPINEAIVVPEQGHVDGPLTAGIIPWGNGYYSLENLKKYQSSAIETESNGQTEIHLTINNEDKQETFVLDPAKNYALMQYSLTDINARARVQNYTNYHLINGSWCPGTVIIEKYDTGTDPQRLLARDIWNITNINAEMPSADSFEVQYEYDALINDYCFGNEPLKYRYSAPEPALSKGIDSELLKSYHLVIAEADKKYPQNCATAALRYVCDSLGAGQSFQKLSEMVKGPEKKTTLYQMQSYAKKLGLAGLAVKTDIAALRNLKDCSVIVHFPQSEHFAVIGGIDEKYVRLIDLSSKSFYRRSSLESFASAWDGTAFIITKDKPAFAAGLALLNRQDLQKITGACGGGGGGGNQQCNTICSTFWYKECVNPDISCGTFATYTYDVYCCGSASSGSCSSSPMLYMERFDCCDVWGVCVDCGDPICYYMDGCAI